MDFDLDTFSKWIIDLAPEYVWIGFDSHPEDVTYPEPSLDKVKSLLSQLKAAGMKVRHKDMRNIR